MFLNLIKEFHFVCKNYQINLKKCSFSKTSGATSVRGERKIPKCIIIRRPENVSNRSDLTLKLFYIWQIKVKIYKLSLINFSLMNEKNKILG